MRDKRTGRDKATARDRCADGDAVPAGQGLGSVADPAELARFHDALARLSVRQGRFERLLRLAIRVGCRVFAFHVDVSFAADPRRRPGRRAGAGCVIAAAPHRAWIEPFLLVAAWPADAERLVWLADERTVTRSWWRRRVLPRVGVIPVGHTVGDPGAYADAAARVLAAGAALVVFPEKGAPSPPERTRAISPGFAYLARRAGAPVIPVVIAGTHHIVRGSSFGIRFLDHIETGEADTDPFARASRPKAHALTDRYAGIVNAALPELNVETDARRPARDRWPWLARLFD